MILLTEEGWHMYCLLISPWTKWSPFRRRHFQMHFHEFTEVCSQGSNYQSISIGWGNGLAPIRRHQNVISHYSDVIMSAMVSQTTGVSIVYSTVCLGADQRKYESSALIAFVSEIHGWPLGSRHEGPVTRKMFSFDDVMMQGRRLSRHRKMRNPARVAGTSSGRSVTEPTQILSCGGMKQKKVVRMREQTCRQSQGKEVHITVRS